MNTTIQKLYLFFLLPLFLTNSIGNAQNCDTSANNRTNLGIYGGSAFDLTYSPFSNRLFAGVLGPSSLFFSDDTGNTWQMAYPYDSLQYNCDEQGWGGGTEKIVANNIGWVIALNKENYGNGTLNSVTLNYNNGEANDWFTLMDSYTMNNLGYGDVIPVDVALTDHFAYASFSHYLIMKGKNSTYTIIDVLSKLNYPDSSQIVCIAPANSTTGFPVYLAIDTSYTSYEQTGTVAHVVYKYDGVNFTKITLPFVTSIARLFSNPIGITGDTLFMEARSTNNSSIIYRVYNGGVNWISITNGFRLEVDYSSYWVSAFPQSKGIMLSMAGKSISSDLGLSFVSLTNSSALSSVTMAEQPNSKNIVACQNFSEIVFSTNWTSGTFSANANDGFANIQINKIARTPHKGYFYLATNSGLAYTTAYTDTNVLAYDKWHTTHGQFPVTNCTGEYGVLAMDPNDSLHVIAGIKDWGNAIGFSLTTSGPSGFSTITPSFTSADGRFGDVEFITSNIVLAVTGAYSKATSGTGNIWRSADGGNNWTNLNVSGFSSGNCIAVAKSLNDTVIYIGTGAGDYDAGKLWKSTDLGVNWTLVNSGPHDIIDSTITSLPITDIIADPRGTDTIYIVSGQSDVTGKVNLVPQAFVKSYNGGLTYIYENVSGYKEFLALEIDPNAPDSNVYLTNYNKIFKYNPALDTTILIHKGMPAEVYSDIAIGSILVGTTTGFYSLHPEENSGDTNYVGIRSDNNKLEYNLYPNPTANEATLKLSLKLSANIVIEVEDVLGRKIEKITQDNLSIGQYEFKISTNNLQNGTYIVNLKINGENNCKLLSVMK